MENNYQLVFNFYSLKFTPYKDRQTASNQILRDVLNYILKEKKDKKGVLIDRHQNRTGENPRELFITAIRFLPKEQRINCRIALLRSGRAPLIKPNNEFELIPFDSSKGSIAEETHFFIDYSQPHRAIVCVDFNYHGPRISDIEYYLRQISHHILKESKATTVEMFMDADIDKTLEDLKNVMDIDIKVNPKNLSQLDPNIQGKYFTGISTLGQKLKPKYVKLQLMYQSQGGTHVNSEHVNKESVGMVKELLRQFKAKPYTVEGFENFVVKYESKEGKEEFFNLIKGKKEILKEIEKDSLKNANDWYNLIKEDFDEFMKSIDG
ncbi:hypothetical protein [Ekhidna sp.]|uniref:hypothetical protein n=1 Tax=Ekhidna sp. TaxID=2608089 RepID=UPI003C7EAB6D